MNNLEFIFHPRSVAFVGATERMGKWGFIIFNNLIEGGFEGPIYPVNPGRAEVLGLKAYPTVKDIPGEVDLAVFTVPAGQVVGAIDDCVAKGVKAGVIISAGFRELGGEGEAREAEMVAKARAAGMVLVGPNGQGICCPRTRLFPWMPHAFHPQPGGVAVVSQSGNIQSMLINGVMKSGFGISKGVSSGNEADLRSEDYFEYFAADPDTEVILSYLEGITDGRRFIERARKASAKKPVVVLKGGRTGAGISAAGSHTGAMAVPDRLFDAVCRQAGLVRVRTIEESGVIASSFLNRPLPRGKRVGIVTGGGGLGVIAADACIEMGLTVPRLSDDLLAKIEKMMPDWWVPGNPVDLVAGMNFPVIVPIMNLLIQSGEIDSLMLLFIGPPRKRAAQTEEKSATTMRFRKMWSSMTKMFEGFAEMMVNMMKERGVPIYVVSNFDDHAEEESTQLLAKARMAIYPDIETASAAIRAMAEYRNYRQRTGVSD